MQPRLITQRLREFENEAFRLGLAEGVWLESCLSFAMPHCARVSFSLIPCRILSHIITRPRAPEDRRDGRVLCGLVEVTTPASPHLLPEAWGIVVVVVMQRRSAGQVRRGHPNRDHPEAEASPVDTVMMEPRDQLRGEGVECYGPTASARVTQSVRLAHRVSSSVPATISS